MPEALFQPTRYPVAQIFSGAWLILRTHFWPLCFSLLVTGLVALLGMLPLGILVAQAPSLHLLWMILENIWINVLIIGFLRAIALRSAGQSADFLSSLWSLQQRDAWLLALVPAILGVLLLQSSGYLAMTAHPNDPAAAIRVVEQPRLWIALIISFLVSTFFQYAFALYAAYGDSPRASLHAALRLFGDRFPWLFFPLLVGLICGIVLFVFFLVIAVLAGLLLGANAAHAPALAIAFTLLLLLLLFPTLIWMYSCIVLAAANLKRAEGDARFLP
jgi:hypothetical protein